MGSLCYFTELFAKGATVVFCLPSFDGSGYCCASSEAESEAAPPVRFGAGGWEREYNWARAQLQTEFLIVFKRLLQL